MRIGIFDVCQEDIQRLKNQLEQKMDQTGRKGCIFEFGSADEVLKFLEESQLDLLFWNIEKGQTVPEEAAVLEEYQKRLYLVFTEEEPVNVSEVYRIRHSFYCLKNRTEDYLEDILARAVQEESGNKERLVVFGKGKIQMIRFADLMYIERSRKVTSLVCEKEVIETSTGLDELEKHLICPPFVRCHNSFIVNLEYLKEFRREEVELWDGTVVPVSRRYQKEVRELLKMWGAF